MFSGTAARPRDPFGEATSGRGEALVPGQWRVGLRGGGEGALPCEVQGGELLYEFPVLVPTLGDMSAVEAVVVREPGDPGLEVLEVEPLTVGCVRGPADRDRGAERLWEIGDREEAIVERAGAGWSSGHRDRIPSRSRLGVGGTTMAERGGLGRTVGPLVKSS